MILYLINLLRVYMPRRVSLQGAVAGGAGRGVGGRPERGRGGGGAGGGGQPGGRAAGADAAPAVRAADVRTRDGGRPAAPAHVRGQRVAARPEARRCVSRTVIKIGEKKKINQKYK